MAEEPAVWSKTLWDRNPQSLPSARRRKLLLVNLQELKRHTKEVASFMETTSQLLSFGRAAGI